MTCVLMKAGGGDNAGMCRDSMALMGKVYSCAQEPHHGFEQRRTRFLSYNFIKREVMRTKGVRTIFPTRRGAVEDDQGLALVFGLAPVFQKRADK